MVLVVLLVAAERTWQRQKSAAQELQTNQGSGGLSAEIVPDAAPGAQPGEPLIAVPPFEIAAGKDQASRLLSKGMHRELVMQLAQNPGLKVISHSPARDTGESAQHPDEVTPVPASGHLLETQILLENGRLRIDARLTDTASGASLWDSAYELETITENNLLGTRNELARDVALALGASLSKAAAPPLSTDTLHALGRVHSKLGRFESARSVYARIRETHPDSPLGYSAAADTFLEQGRLDLAMFWFVQGQAVEPGDFDLAARIVSLFDNLGHHDGARTWSTWLDRRITKQPLPLAMQAKHHYLNGNFELALQYANLSINLGLDNRGNSEALFMRLKRDEAIANGDPAPGIALFLERYPELRAQAPEIPPEILQQAVLLASLFSLNGEKQRAATLLETSIETCDKPYTIAGPDNMHLTPVKAEALALLGRRDDALAELRRIIDAGWRSDWLWSTDLNASFNGIRDAAEFRAMVQELAIDVAAQRIAVEDMEAEGKIGRPAEPESNPELEALRNYTK
jgi:TolB-like protein